MKPQHVIGLLGYLVFPSSAAGIDSNESVQMSIGCTFLIFNARDPWAVELETTSLKNIIKNACLEKLFFLVGFEMTCGIYRSRLRLRDHDDVVEIGKRFFIKSGFLNGSESRIFGSIRPFLSSIVSSY